MTIFGLHPDHQVALILILASLVGLVIWAVRAIRHARHVLDDAPYGEYEHAAHHWHGSALWEDER